MEAENKFEIERRQLFEQFKCGNLSMTKWSEELDYLEILEREELRKANPIQSWWRKVFIFLGLRNEPS